MGESQGLVLEWEQDSTTHVTHFQDGFSDTVPHSKLGKEPYLGVPIPSCINFVHLIYSVMADDDCINEHMKEEANT